MTTSRDAQRQEEPDRGPHERSDATPAAARGTPLRNVAGSQVRRLLATPGGRAVGDVPVVSNRSLADRGPETRADGIHTPTSGVPGPEALAHEVAHAMQQRAGTDHPTGPRAALEADAARVARDTMAGRPSRPLLRAPRTARLGYEAWEHTSIGDARGGGGVTVVTRSGVELTYGQIVALSGDFYRSPEALMNAPADELNELKSIMGDEATAAAASPEGRPTEEQIAGYTERYEIATSRRGSQAEYHRHDDLETLWQEEGEGHGGRGGHGGHEGHEGNEEEMVESAGPGAVHPVPGAEASFLELADRNASHFSPVNVRNNYIPGHQRALDRAREAWQLRNPGSEPPETSGGESPSAREGTQPATGAEALPGPPPTTTGGADTEARRIDARSPDRAEQLEAEAWLTDGWANHYLTDAFAAGHLVSGNVGRTAGAIFFQTQGPAVADALGAAIAADHGIPLVVGRMAAAHVLGLSQAEVDLPADAQATLDEVRQAVVEKLPSMALKLVHDALNVEGLWVKDAQGVEWRTVGDGQLALSGPTQSQAEEASRVSRESVQDVLRTGATTQAMRALDLIPDVARLADTDYRPIETFARDPAVFQRYFEQTMLPASPADNKLYAMLAGNLGLVGVLVEQAWIREVEGPAEQAIDEAVGWGRELWSGVEQTTDDVAAWGGEQVAGVQEDIGELARWGSGLLDDAGDDLMRAGESVGDTLHGLHRKGDAAWRSVRQVFNETVDDVTTIDTDEAGLADRFFDWTGEKAEQLGLVDTEATPATGETAVDPVHNQTYMHGGAMGLAGSFMQDRTWSSILARLMPEVYTRATAADDPKGLMMALENNPVLAAYGTARHQAVMPPSDVASTPPVRMEWDVWLDPTDPRNLDGAKIAHGNMPTTVGHASAPTDTSYYDRPEVREGPSVTGWMQAYSLALEMAGEEPPPVPGPDLGELSTSATPAAALNMTMTYPEALAAPGGVFLDVKSRYSEASDIAAFIEEVEASGVNIIGVGTFQYEQIDEQDRETRGTAPMQVKFTQGVDDMAAAVEDGRIRLGDQVMFNGGDLLRWTPMGYGLDGGDLDHVRDMAREFDLELGIYVQEYAVSPEAVGQLTQLVNEDSALFGLGFAYGSVSGRSATGVEGGGMPLGQWGAEQFGRL